jgi:hypothetical protein
VVVVLHGVERKLAKGFRGAGMAGVSCPRRQWVAGVEEGGGGGG